MAGRIPGNVGNRAWFRLIENPVATIVLLWPANWTPKPLRKWRKRVGTFRPKTVCSYSSCNAGQMAAAAAPRSPDAVVVADAIRIVTCSMYEARQAKGWDRHARKLGKSWTGCGKSVGNWVSSQLIDSRPSPATVAGSKCSAAWRPGRQSKCGRIAGSVYVQYFVLYCTVWRFTRYDRVTHVTRYADFRLRYLATRRLVWPVALPVFHCDGHNSEPPTRRRHRY